MNVIRIDDVARQAWRNGGGQTRELLAWPDAADWRFRISVADIESDGPFSIFPAVQRWFVVLKGAGVELTIDERTERLTRNSLPLCFAGVAATGCRLLDGPTLDLNLMLRDAPGSMQVVADGRDWRPDLAQCGLFTAVAGRWQADDAAIALPPYSLLWFDRAPVALSFQAAQRPASATGWWLEAGAAGSEP